MDAFSTCRRPTTPDLLQNKSGGKCRIMRDLQEICGRFAHEVTATGYSGDFAAICRTSALPPPTISYLDQHALVLRRPRARARYAIDDDVASCSPSTTTLTTTATTTATATTSAERLLRRDRRLALADLWCPAWRRLASTGADALPATVCNNKVIRLVGIISSEMRVLRGHASVSHVVRLRPTTVLVRIHHSTFILARLA